MMILRAFLAFCLGLVMTANVAAHDLAQKRIALTFDDIPRHAGAFIKSEDERAERIIAALGSVQAAFFLNPGRIAERPGAEARILRYVKAGHVIANHAANHPRLSKTEVAEYVADIDAAEAWLEGREGVRPWFRFPFLDEGGRDKDKRDALRAALAERGLSNGYVTVDASDWFYDGAASAALEAGQRVDMAALRELFIESHVQSAQFTHELSLRALGRAPAQVMLLHETDLVALFLDDLIKALQENGWTIVSADEAFADPIAQIQTDVPFAQGTLIESVAWERKLPAPRWYERNDTKLAEKLFQTRVLGLEPETPDATSAQIR